MQSKETFLDGFDVLSDTQKIQFTVHIDELRNFASAWIDHISNKTLRDPCTKSSIMPSTLSGVIGAGKSTFVKSILETMEVLDGTQPFTSPSFSILNEYYIDDDIVACTHILSKIHSPYIYHFDLYRLQHAYEAEDLGFYQIIHQGLVFIEWPERIAWNIPLPYYKFSFEIIDEHSRFVSIEICY